MRMLSRSDGTKLAMFGIAVVGIVLVSEMRGLDSLEVGAALESKDVPSPGSKLTFTATAYCKGTTTASGVAVRSGIAAADPALLPVGSVVKVTTHDPAYNGVYTVMDTGPKVQGRILDLYIWSCYEALSFGRRPIEVTVLRLGWDPAASSPALVDRLFRDREASFARRTPARQSAAALMSPVNKAAEYADLSLDAVSEDQLGDENEQGDVVAGTEGTAGDADPSSPASGELPDVNGRIETNTHD
jgi:3D (Asp-Asp-Asp) domain-containing protein